MIDKDTLRPGDRIPAIRKMSMHHRVSISTVQLAYVTLEDLGIVEARPQSGYYVRLEPRKYPPEPKISNPKITANKVSISNLMQEVFGIVGNTNFVQLGAAFLNPENYPYKKLNRLIGSVARRLGPLSTNIDTPPGNVNLRRQIALRSLELGCSLTIDDIVTTCGCMEAINLCLRAVANPGDTRY